MAKATKENLAKAVQRFYFLVSIVLGVIALDQGTKLLVMNTFALYEIKPVVPGFFNLTCIIPVLPLACWPMCKGPGNNGSLLVSQ